MCRRNLGSLMDHLLTYLQLYQRECGQHQPYASTYSRSMSDRGKQVLYQRNYTRTYWYNIAVLAATIPRPEKFIHMDESWKDVPYRKSALGVTGLGRKTSVVVQPIGNRHICICRQKMKHAQTWPPSHTTGVLERSTQEHQNPQFLGMRMVRKVLRQADASLPLSVRLPKT
jgi:hypothetical protein